MYVRKDKSDAQKIIETALALSGMTQAQLAEKLGKSPSSFSQKLAKGRFTVEEYKKIGELTGLRFVCRYEENYL